MRKRLTVAALASAALLLAPFAAAAEETPSPSASPSTETDASRTRCTTARIRGILASFPALATPIPWGWKLHGSPGPHSACC